MTSAFRRLALSIASAGALAVLGFAATASASTDPFTSTLKDPTNVSSANNCQGFGCALTLTGTQTSQTGGQGSYSIVTKANLPAWNSAKNQFCMTLGAGSHIRLNYSAGSLTMATDGGPFCGPTTTNAADGTVSYVFSGPYTVSGGVLPFDGASGSGTVSLTLKYNALTQNLQHTGIGLVGTLSLPPVGGIINPPGGLPNLGATPELDSLLLFGAGALGLAGYGLTRARAARKQRSA